MCQQFASFWAHTRVSIWAFILYDTNTYSRSFVRSFVRKNNNIIEGGCAESFFLSYFSLSFSSCAKVIFDALRPWVTWCRRVESKEHQWNFNHVLPSLSSLILSPFVVLVGIGAPFGGIFFSLSLSISFFSFFFFLRSYLLQTPSVVLVDATVAFGKNPSGHIEHTRTDSKREGEGGVFNSKCVTLRIGRARWWRN